MEKAGDDAAVVEPLLQLQSQSQSHQSQPPEDDTNQHQTQAPAPADVSPGEQQQQQGQQGQQGHYQQGEHRQEEEESHQQDQHQQHQQQHQHSEPPRPAPHDASATADPAQQMPMSQQAPLLPPMQFQHPQQHSQQQQQHAPPPPAHIQDGMTRQASPQHMNNMAQHQQHAPPPPPPPPPPAQNGNGVQYPNHAPPNYGYAPDPAMQQSLPVMQSNGAPPNGYHPQMAYQMAMPQQGLNTNQLSGTRHKKEIKRRTKTGCLTCRRRRIKCDEGHPTCRNCIKSKRECLGYDPVFKTQGQPATIQPAPGTGTGTGTLPPPPPIKAEAQMAAEAPQYSNVPQGYMPAASAGYSPASALQPPMDYAAAIDPALAPVNSALAPPPPPPPPPQEEYSTSLHPQRNVRQVGVDGLFTVDDVPPSFPPPRHPNTPLPPHEIDAIRSIYTMEYAPGLDRFFETTWYSDHGFNLLLGNMELLHYFAYCLDRFRRGQHDPSIRGLMSLEARLVWQLGNLPASVQANPLPPHIVTILQRIDVVRNLLCGTFMDPSLVPVSPPSNAPDPKAVDHYAQYLQDAFWHHLGRFVSIRDDVVSPDAAQQIAAALAAMRNILSMLENRDVLYSMAIARHFGGRMADFHLEKSLVSRSAEPDDPIAKLAVAMNFIRDEEAQGTTQAVQRFCGMCRRGWVLQRQN